VSYIAGDIVNFHNPRFPEQSHPHIIIAKIDQHSYLVVCSTKVGSVQKKCAFVEEKSADEKLATYVILPAGIAPSLPVISAINCNETFRHDLTILQQKEEVEFRARANDNVGAYYLKIILKGVCDSKLTDPLLKEVICK